MRRVLFAGGGTGGHLYPALALAAAMRAEAADIEVHFVGAKRGVEASVLPRRGEAHTLLPIEPVRRAAPWRNWRLVPSLVASFRGVTRLFRGYAPQLVVGTGGYASGPACLWAVARRVPMAVQEQNAYPGMTTRLLARWASQVHLGFGEARGRIRPGASTRVRVHGNPIRAPDFGLERGTCRTAYGLDPEAIVLLVVGGSQGSKALNLAVAAAIEGAASGELPRPARLALLWATGPAHVQPLTERLSRSGIPPWVRMVGYIDDMPRALAASDIALSRAGAMMTAELLAWGIPSILVPLPTAAADHQKENARAIEAAGAAVCIEERALTPESLWRELTALASDPARRAAMTGAAKARSRPDAARAIARDLLELLPVA